LHILFFPSWYPADTDDLSGSFFREQAIALADAGANVGVLAPTLRSLRQPVNALFGDSKLRIEMDLAVHTYRASTAHLTPTLSGPTVRRIAVLAERMFADYVADRGLPDILHVQAALPIAQAAINISKKHNLPIIYTEHSSAFARGLIDPKGLALAARVARQATRCFAVSKPFADLLEQKFDMPVGSIGVMPNSVHESFLTHRLSRANDGRIRFLHVSLLDPIKNVSGILAAFSAAFVGNENVELVIGGDGPDRPSLEQQAKTLGIAKQVTFCGRLSRGEVVTAMAAADVFVLASKHETFGVVAIEALAMGLPVVATRCGGPEDIIEEGDGLLVPVNDTAALATGMTQLGTLGTIEDRAALREKCRKRYGAAEIAARWLNIYAEAITRHGAQR
tara:strand:- start:1980 stop:3158 length:1179 start_codon:yes stop_codon:yes gene_type:complete